MISDETDAFGNPIPSPYSVTPAPQPPVPVVGATTTTTTTTIAAVVGAFPATTTASAASAPAAMVMTAGDVPPPLPPRVPHGILTVTVLQARGLPRTDYKLKDSDPYVKLAVDAELVDAEKLAKADPTANVAFAQTQVGDRQDAVWHETFAFPIYDRRAGGASPSKLHVEVWDSDWPTADDFMARGTIDVPAWLLADGVESALAGQNPAELNDMLHERQRCRVGWLPVFAEDGKTPAGEVHLDVYYLPKTIVQRMQMKMESKTDKVKAKADKVKDKLTSKLVHKLTDLTASKIKLSFGKGESERAS
ncbi:hypothetical protein AMAG_06779 [Allomyces macrogynus ATCC 38327]|uniref:C2 domain-containing protein n=1 Tax=Allomyces macrogynus (strain ATCC 38327) TaxID=578462 RepID=A0A0L0SER6_ALLM3|nr:hypothetical protein AMAG_06779 [Allomyces macrogynus ATCC 38327]|eukprot:KNE61018.1 hypothetical protein AMAG_06779 [Allomyces macrogynus ATCC 38327]